MHMYANVSAQMTYNIHGYLQGGIKGSMQTMNTGKYPTHLQPPIQQRQQPSHTTWFSHFLDTGNRRTMNPDT